MNSLIQFEIPKRSARCSQQGEQFLPGMDVYSLLSESDEDTFVRHDFCLHCWNHPENERNLKQSIRSYWKSKIEPRKIVKKSPQIAKGLILLQELLNNSNLHEAEIYVLCLFLAHARQMILRREILKEGILYHLYEILNLDQFVTVKTIDLSTPQIEVIQKSLASQLHACR